VWSGEKGERKLWEKKPKKCGSKRKEKVEW
jgi:hypothetical protein